MNLYVGTSGYSYKKWKGTFYPKGLPDKQMLGYYGERFRTVEINNTFRQTPKASVLEAWAGAVPTDSSSCSRRRSRSRTGSGSRTQAIRCRSCSKSPGL